VITFRKADATIKLATFEAEPSGDIWFQFKTTATDGVIIHNIGDSLDGDADFIQVELASKRFLIYYLDFISIRLFYAILIKINVFECAAINS